MFEERKNQVSHKKKREPSPAESFENQNERLAVVEVPRSLLAQTEPPQKGHILLTAVEILFGLFDGGRLVRLIGPNDRPLERHEFENAEFNTQRPGPGVRW